MLSSGLQCYHLKLMLSSVTKCYHLVLNVIIWDVMLSSEANVIIWDEMLSSGANVIIWDEMLSSGMQCYHLSLFSSKSCQGKGSRCLIFCTCGWWKSSGSVAAMFAGCVLFSILEVFLPYITIIISNK
jgi:hypothetical protein